MLCLHWTKREKALWDNSRRAWRKSKSHCRTAAEVSTKTKMVKSKKKKSGLVCLFSFSPQTDFEGETVNEWLTQCNPVVMYVLICICIFSQTILATWLAVVQQTKRNSPDAYWEGNVQWRRFNNNQNSSPTDHKGNLVFSCFSSDRIIHQVTIWKITVSSHRNVKEKSILITNKNKEQSKMAAYSSK